MITIKFGNTAGPRYGSRPIATATITGPDLNVEGVGTTAGAALDSAMQKAGLTRVRQWGDPYDGGVWTLNGKEVEVKVLE